jgi:ribosome biogenesis GTPase
MQLAQLGWDEHYQSQVDELGIPDIVIGRIFRVDAGGHYSVITKEGDLRVRIPGKMKNRASSAADLPGIGDWVLIKSTEIDNVIFKVLERKNVILRKAAGREFKEQLVGANIDIIFIVMGLDSDFNLRRLERYLFMVASSGASPVVLLNKSDLAEDMESQLDGVQKIAEDIPIHSMSALKKEGMELISGYLKEGVTISVVGSSGVGKSTLINALMKEEKLKTGDVRKKDGKGRHVTASRELFLIPGGGVIIDNPGIREIQLWGDAASLDDAFSDIGELAEHCKFRDCQHRTEPGCKVREAVENGELPKERYENYLKMQKELAYLEMKRDRGAEATEKARWKGILKNADKYKKYKKERG